MLSCPPYLAPEAELMASKCPHYYYVFLISFEPRRDTFRDLNNVHLWRICSHITNSVTLGQRACTQLFEESSR